ncbi:MAG: hypothetical protein JW797_04040 [Bradymonadales bacterium]|nr:hypothetical protein [Bradymonadales bacterium]
MTDDNDVTGTGNGGSGNGGPPQDQEPQRPAPAAIRDRMERAASRVISEKLGKPLDEDGKVDMSTVTQAEMEENVQELVFGILKAFGDELGAISAEAKQAEVTRKPAPATPSQEAAPSEIQADETTTFKPEDTGAEPPDQEGTSGLSLAMEALGKRIQEALADKLSKHLGMPLENLDQLDANALEKSAVVQQIASKLYTWTESLAELLQQGSLAAAEAAKRDLPSQVGDVSAEAPSLTATEGIPEEMDEERVSEPTAIEPTAGPSLAEEPEEAGTQTLPLAPSLGEQLAEVGRTGADQPLEPPPAETSSPSADQVETEAEPAAFPPSSSEEGAQDSPVATPEASGEGEGGAEEEQAAGKPEDNVIDLEAWRQRLEAKRDSPVFKIGESIQESLNRFFEQTMAKQPLQTGGTTNIQLDDRFFKEYGASLLQTVLRDVAKNLVPPKVELTLPMTDEEKAAKAAPSTPAEPVEGEASEIQEPAQPSEVTEDAPQAGQAVVSDIKVSVKFDFKSLLANLLKKPDGGPKGPEEPGGNQQ